MATPEERVAIRAAEQRLVNAEREKANADLRLMRHEVGMELKLDPVISSRLVGSTREEMIADAKQLGAEVDMLRGPEVEDEPGVDDWIRKAAGRGSAPTVEEPAEERTVTIDGGARQSTAPPVDMNDLIRNARERVWGQ